MIEAGTTQGRWSVELDRRINRLRAAVQACAGQVPDEVLGPVHGVLDEVEQRLGMGVDHAVVALAGGTGSGKSSMFNAISGLTFADVGVKRPTTSQATACVWGSGADSLLDWLAIAPDRRIQRESLLDADDEEPLRGLVLLDLPDHDSVAGQHREVVDRTVPVVDLLVWVVDPQKYADDALHAQYLRDPVVHGAPMVVLLNQVDTLPEGALPEIVADLQRLLAEDGIDAPVHPVSARTGEGIAELRARLGRLAAGRTVAADRLDARLDEVVAALGAEVGQDEAGEVEEARSGVLDVLLDDARVGATARRLAAEPGTAERTLTDATVPVPTAVRARARWLAAAGKGLPAAWQAALDREVPAALPLAFAANVRLGEVTVQLPRTRWSGVLAVLGWVVGALALAPAGMALGQWLGGDRLSAVVLAAAAGLVLAAALALTWARALARRARRRRELTVLRAARAALALAVDDVLTEPTLVVLDRHRTARVALAAAARER